MVPYDVMHEQIMDILTFLVWVGMYISIYVYGRYKYDQGYRKGLRDKRKINRAIRRGNVYRF